MARPGLPSRRLIILLVVTALGLMTLDARSVGPFNGVRRGVFAVTQPLRGVVDIALSPVADAWNGAVHYDSIEEENAQLRARVVELEATVDRLPEAEAELESMLTASNIDYLAEIPRVTARVVADRDTNLERIVEIDKGSDDGLIEGQPVVTGNGLVGRLLAVEGSRSQIRLISDPRLSVGVINPTTRAIGVTAGDGNGEDLVLDLADGAIDSVNSGTRFETSGFEQSRYPGGIPVGRLVLDDDEVRLDPIADLDNLGYVTVLLVVPSVTPPEEPES